MGARGHSQKPQGDGTVPAEIAANVATDLLAESIPTCDGMGKICMFENQGSQDPANAGVERVFSAAGKMHGDLRQSSKDTTLEHSLFAAFNTD